MRGDLGDLKNTIHGWADDLSMFVADLARTKTNSLREAPFSLRGRGPGYPPFVTLSRPSMEEFFMQ